MNILLEGIFYNGHGLAEGNRILLRMLDRAGLRVRIVARDASDKFKVLDSEEIGYISSFEHTRLAKHDLYLFNWVGTYAKYRPDFKINIARTTFETDRIPGSWVPELNKFNEVWVQSSFNRQSFLASGVSVPLRLIPNFFDMNRYQPTGANLQLPVVESFLFLSVFDLKDRKGYDVLLNAFLTEFSRQDDTALVIKLRDNDRREKIEAIIAAHPKPDAKKPRIYLIDQMLSQEELLGLYRSCHAFVLPTRGEGWGRPFFEAMLMELPCIGTNWSGQTDFMHEDNSYLIAVDEIKRIENNENELFIDHHWAEPSKQDLQRKMRRVRERENEAKHKARNARVELLHKYSMEQTAGKVLQEITKYNRKHSGGDQ
ncbi:glycosyltransferase [Paenibacillus koleovorans]|uniref:glycosyltransferase n=1 Tax=Paenibacillus koleovorans TaxID=121608 RepID=UPI000FD6EB7A|nr:glycosyltransferase [Paenibacillus koleovorans]